MRKLSSLSLIPIASVVLASSVLVGCGGGMSSYVHSDSTLGRVVVYRNGVAYFERTARAESDKLTLQVPGDKVDDFLKSLTVVDAETGKPAPISYPTQRTAVGPNGLIDMQIGIPTGSQGRFLRLSYVTEAPSWKPSYRVTVQDNGKVALQAWAIVDNTSGEDWKNVKLGVGSSSALSFRFDLQSVRTVQRETLQSNDLFALAPPTGGPTYGGQGNVNQQQRVLGDFRDDSVIVALNDATKKVTDGKAPAPPPTTATAGVGHASGGSGGGYGAAYKGVGTKPAPDMERYGGGGGGLAANSRSEAQIAGMARAIQTAQGQVMIEGFAKADEKDAQTASLDRANVLRNQLIQRGVDPNKVVAVGKGKQSGYEGGARLVEANNVAQPAPQGAAPTGKDGKAIAEGPGDPIGTSHFDSPSAMSVPRNTSAMVSILDAKTDGEIVYLYDAEGPRGNATYPFKAVRMKNTSDSTLESGPVTVFGEGKFIGEGIAEPVPPGALAFVPFALDRQVVVEHGEGERDDISRIIKVNRGVFSTEVQHVRKTSLVLSNRLSAPASVYLKHHVRPGYKLIKSPDGPVVKEKLDGAQIAHVKVPANGKLEVFFEEATPVTRSIDVRTNEGLGQVKLFLAGTTEGPLRKAVDDLLKLNDDMVKVQHQIETSRQQMEEYKQRIDELHMQIVTLKAVKSAGPLMASLEKKMQEFSDKLSKATIDLVSQQEKLMIARVHFEDGVAELSLEEAPAKKADK